MCLELFYGFTDGEQGHIKSDEDDYESGFLSEEEETHIMGGEGFSPEELAKAEARFTESFAKVEWFTFRNFYFSWIILKWEILQLVILENVWSLFCASKNFT